MGSERCARKSAACTSTAALSMSRSWSNSSVTWDSPGRDTEVTRCTPATTPTASSTGRLSGILSLTPEEAQRAREAFNDYARRRGLASLAYPADIAGAAALYAAGGAAVLMAGAARTGMHIQEDHFIVELENGELVVTTIMREAMLASKGACPCA